MSRPDRDRPALAGLDLDMVDGFERGMLDEDHRPTADLVRLARHHLLRLRAEALPDPRALRDHWRMGIMTCATPTVAGRPAADVEGHERREDPSAGVPRLIRSDGVARSLRSKLRRDRMRLGLAAEGRRTRG